MFSKLLDELFDHPKIIMAGDLVGGPHGPAIALGLYTAGLLYANRHLTDGILPIEIVKRWPHSRRPLTIAAALVEAKLWEITTAGAFKIHDFLDHNFTADAVKERRAWDVNRKALYSNPGLVGAIRARDGDACRYCGRTVNWHDRRGALGGQYDHVNPRGENTLTNVVVACRGCNNKKGGRTPEQARMALRPAPNLMDFGTSSELGQT